MYISKFLQDQYCNDNIHVIVQMIVGLYDDNTEWCLNFILLNGD